MKPMSQTLIDNQRSRQRTPYIVPTFTYNARMNPHDEIVPHMFKWTTIDEDGAISATYHGVAIPADGSLNRVRSTSNKIYHQRVTSPDEDSDYSSWTNLGNTPTTPNPPMAIAAYGTRVMIVTAANAGNATDNIYISTDSGANFTGSRAASLTGTDAIAVAAKDANNFCVFFSNGADLSQAKWNSVSGWAFGGHGSPPTVGGLAAYYDGDYNVIVLVIDGSDTYLSRYVYGDGYKVSSGVWSDGEKIGTGNASIENIALINQYLERLEPYSDFEFEANNIIRIIGNWSNSFNRNYRMLPQYVEGLILDSPHYNVDMTRASSNYGKKNAMPERNKNLFNYIQSLRATDNLNMDAPFVCGFDDKECILSCYKTLTDAEKWFFRLKSGSDFYDSKWETAYRWNGSCAYGIALADDGTYLWGTRANAVYRSLIPGRGWINPNSPDEPSSGIAVIGMDDIYYLRMSTKAFSKGEIELHLENSDGTYDALPSLQMSLGNSLQVQIGYSDEIHSGRSEKYFIDSIEHVSEPNMSKVIVRGSDLYNQLDLYKIPAQQEYNFNSDDMAVYDIIEKLLNCLYSEIDYISRSTLITSLYPKITIKAGTTGLTLLKRLLDLVPDFMIFYSNIGYVVYPQDTDAMTYEFIKPSTLA